MLKYLEIELNKTNDEIKDFTLEKKKLENKIVELESIIEGIEEYMFLEEMMKSPILISCLCTAFIACTVPIIFLALYMLPIVLFCDVAVGAVDIGNIITIIKKRIEMAKIKKILGDREISKKEKYMVQRDLDDCDKRLSGFSVLIMMKERDALELKSIIQSDNWLEELKENPFFLKNALNYEFDEYLHEVLEIPISNVHLNELGKIRKLERKEKVFI